MLEPEDLGKRKSDLAQELRRLRRQAGLTGDRLAARAGMSQSKISKIETGKILPSLLDVERLLRALGAEPRVVEELSALARRANTDYQDWKASLRRGLHHKQQELATLEATSSRFRYFLPAMITGLLHTPEYARASLATTRGDHSKAIARRLDRQAVLYEEDKHFTFILTEQALRWPLCRGKAMSVQMGRLSSLLELPNVRIGVIPLRSSPIPEGPLTTFTIYDDALATVEMFTGALLLRDPRDVHYYLELFASFERAALFDGAARGFIANIAEDFRNQS